MKLQRTVLLAAALIVVTLLTGCKQGDVPLGDGYRLILPDQKFRAILRFNDIEVVPANIEEIGFSEYFIYGLIDPQPYIEFHEGKGGKNYKGYFILNKKTGEVTFALPRAEWRDMLARGGVANPVLKIPDDMP
jgi:hypothetical protein